VRATLVIRDAPLPVSRIQLSQRDRSWGEAQDRQASALHRRGRSREADGLLHAKHVRRESAAAEFASVAGGCSTPGQAQAANSGGKPPHSTWVVGRESNLA